MKNLIKALISLIVVCGIAVTIFLNGYDLSMKDNSRLIVVGVISFAIFVMFISRLIQDKTSDEGVQVTKSSNPLVNIIYTFILIIFTLFLTFLPLGIGLSLKSCTLILVFFGIFNLFFVFFQIYILSRKSKYLRYHHKSKLIFTVIMIIILMIVILLCTTIPWMLFSCLF